MFEPVKWSGGENAKEPPSTFRRYTEQNLKRGLGEIETRAAHNEKLYIVCSGPSLSETWTELTAHQGKVWALNAAFDWLCKNAIRPDYGVCLAPEDPIVNYFQEMRAGDQFLFASQTHPELLDRAKERGASVTLWHTKHPDEWDMPERKGPHIYGGGTVGSRSFELAYALGYRDVHVLGMDACLSPDGRIAVDTPMYEARRPDLRTFVVSGRPFVAMPSHARQVEDFASVVRPLKDMNITLYGDGMLQWSQAQTQENA